MARREERAYREYVSDEQRSQPGCPARELCDESLLQDTRVRLKPDATEITVRLKPDTTGIATGIGTVRLPAFALRASARSRRSSAAIVRSGGGKPNTRDIATTSAHTSALFDADFARDVRAAVVVVLEAVAQVELPD